MQENCMSCIQSRTYLKYHPLFSIARNGFDDIIDWEHQQAKRCQPKTSKRTVPVKIAMSDDCARRKQYFVGKRGEGKNGNGCWQCHVMEDHLPCSVYRR